MVPTPWWTACARLAAYRLAGALGLASALLLSVVLAPAAWAGVGAEGAEEAVGAVATMGAAGAADAGAPPRFETHYRIEDPQSVPAEALAALEWARGQRDWVPYQGVLSLGFGAQAYWVRVTLSAAGSTGPRVLRMRPSFLDDVRVYVLGPDGLEGPTPVYAVGDRQIRAGALLYDGALTMDLPALKSPASQVLYIRVQTTSARMAGLWVQAPADAERSRTIENLLMGVYFGVMLCLLAWSVGHALLDRDVVFGWYAVYQAASAMMNFGLLGYARVFLPEGWSPDAWSTAFVLSISVFAPLFHLSLVRSVMAPAPVPRAIRAVLWGAFMAAVLNLVQVPMGRVGPALAVNANLVTLLALVLACLAVFQALRQPQSPLRRLLLGYMLMCVLTVWTLLPLIGALQGGTWSLFSTSIHGLLLALLLAAMLLVRGAELKAQAQRSRQQVLEEQARTRQAQDERDEKDRFLSMLTHELRTPLSVIRMVIDGVRRREEASAARRQLDLARTAVTDIDQVIEASLQVDRLERRALQARQADCDLGALARLCVQSLEPASARRVRLEVPAEPVPLRSDPMLLRVILVNLLDNALKYSPVDSTVDLVVRPAAGGLSGPGGGGVEGGVGRAGGDADVGADVGRDGAVDRHRAGPLLRVCNRPGRAGRPDPAQVFRKYYRSEGAQHSTGSGQGLYLVDGLARHLGAVARCEPGRQADVDSPVCFELEWGGGPDAFVDPDRRGP